jgi:hypothetical protein
MSALLAKDIGPAAEMLDRSSRLIVPKRKNDRTKMRATDIYNARRQTTRRPISNIIHLTFFMRTLF